MMRVGVSLVSWRRQVGNGGQAVLVICMTAMIGLFAALKFAENARLSAVDTSDTAIAWIGLVVLGLELPLCAVMLRAWRGRWGVLHGFQDERGIVLGNPYLLACGRRPRFAPGEHVTYRVRSKSTTADGTIRVRLVGGKAATTVMLHGTWTQAQAAELEGALAHIGLVPTPAAAR